MGDVVKVGLYILLFLPGFIFVQTRDYHLVRSTKGQFEKTLDVILWSAILWIGACMSPIFCPYDAARRQTLELVGAGLRNSNAMAVSWATTLNRPAAEFFVTVCIWAFFLANLWGLVRKQRRVDALIKFVTGRDWYPTVPFRFFSENIDKVIVVKTERGSYMGILSGAPDVSDDPYVILTHPAFLKNEPGSQPEPLTLVRQLLIKYEDYDEIQALSGGTILETPRDSGVRGNRQVQRVAPVVKRYIGRLQSLVNQARERYGRASRSSRRVTERPNDSKRPHG